MTTANESSTDKSDRCVCHESSIDVSDRCFGHEILTDENGRYESDRCFGDEVSVTDCLNGEIGRGYDRRMVSLNRNDD